MNIWLLILQIVLVVCWYAVPAMAVVSAWIVFLPLLLVGAVWAGVLVFMGFCALMAYVLTR